MWTCVSRCTSTTSGMLAMICQSCTLWANPGCGSNHGVGYLTHGEFVLIIIPEHSADVGVFVLSRERRLGWIATINLEFVR